MTQSIDTRRILIFITLSFGIAWTVALLIYFTGGIIGSPMLVPALNLTQATTLLVLLYMPAPALAHILTRIITHEGWKDTMLRLRFRAGWPSWLAAWLLPAVLVIVGGTMYFVIFPNQFDSQLSTLQSMIDQSGQDIPLTASTLLIVQTVQALLLAPVINALPTLGEEFGWRAYLQPKLLPLGWRTAMVLMGVIWGIWHWPVIAMGYNYGTGYPGAPWTGMLAMVWFTFTVGTMLGWLTVRGGSVWPAVIGHGAVNGIAALPALVAKGNANPLLGPLPIGIISSAGFTLVALWMLFNEPQPPQEAVTQP